MARHHKWAETHHDAQKSITRGEQKWLRFGRDAVRHVIGVIAWNTAGCRGVGSRRRVWGRRGGCERHAGRSGRHRRARGGPCGRRLGPVAGGRGARGLAGCGARRAERAVGCRRRCVRGPRGQSACGGMARRLRRPRGARRRGGGKFARRSIQNIT